MSFLDGLKSLAGGIGGAIKKSLPAIGAVASFIPGGQVVATTIKAAGGILSGGGAALPAVGGASFGTPAFAPPGAGYGVPGGNPFTVTGGGYTVASSGAGGSFLDQKIAGIPVKGLALGLVGFLMAKKARLL